MGTENSINLLLLFLQTNKKINEIYMSSLRKKIKESESGFWFLIKKVYLFKKDFAIPAPKVVWLPLRYFISFVVVGFQTVKSIFFVTPLYKTYFEEVGRGFSATSCLPFVTGKGRIFVGDNVKIFGKVDFIFGSVGNQLPEIYIGNDVRISHNITFDVTSKLVIGDKTLIAAGVTIQDSSGHSVDPVARANGEAPTSNEVRSVEIGNNVWICSSVYILPGVKVGDDCVLGVGVILKRSVLRGEIVFSPSPIVKKYRNLSNYHMHHRR